ncbi:MAG: hypothetical protein J5657_04735 [Clostridiales bacterium]|nr:hypothetical protein [Clostridiales bacterium]
MNIHKIYAAIVAVLMSALFFASCFNEDKDTQVTRIPTDTEVSEAAEESSGKETESSLDTEASKESSKKETEASADTEASKEIPVFEHDEFYVMVGINEYTDDQNIRLRYFHGDDIDMVVWKRAPAGFKYGDVFIPEGDVTPENVVVNEDDPAYPRSWFELKGDADLKFIGNCKDLMETKKLTVTRNDYDGMRHFSIDFKDEDGNEYYFGFFDIGVDVSMPETGGSCDCAVNKGKIIIPFGTPRGD